MDCPQNFVGSHLEVQETTLDLSTPGLKLQLLNSLFSLNGLGENWIEIVRVSNRRELFIEHDVYLDVLL